MTQPAYDTPLRACCIALLALSLTVAARAVRAEDCTMKRLVELPMIANETSSPVVSISVDGQPRNMLLDTGGFWSLLSPPVAAGLASRNLGNVGWLGLDGLPLTTVVKAPSVRIGPAGVENVDFLVSPPQYGNYDGTLGANWLKVFDVEIDPVRNTASLFSQNHCVGQVVYWPHQDLAEVPVNIDRFQKTITVPLSLNDQKIDALIDTGAPETVISVAVAQRLFGLTPSSPGMERIYMTDQSGKVREAYRYQFKSLQMGDITFRNPWLLITRIARGPEMILGMHHLHGLHLYFAYGEGKLYVTSAQGDIVAGKPADSGGTAVSSRDADPLGKVNARDFIQTATADIRKNNTTGAMAAVNKALQSDPNSSTAYLFRAGLYILAHQNESAFKDLDEAIRLNPKNGGAFAQRGQLYWSEKNLNGAYADMNKALEIDPNYTPGYELRAELNMALGQRDDAINDATHAIQLMPSNVIFRLERARLYTLGQNYAAGLDDLTTALRLQPKLAAALNMKCAIETQLDKPEAALPDCNAAVAIEPRNPVFLQMRGYVHLRSKLFNLAIDDYNSALAVNPKLAGALYGRGLAKQRIGDEKGGDADLALAKAIDPKIAENFGK